MKRTPTRSAAPALNTSRPAIPMRSRNISGSSARESRKRDRDQTRVGGSSDIASGTRLLSQRLGRRYSADGIRFLEPMDSDEFLLLASTYSISTRSRKEGTRL